ncbi:MAG: hypothetical protein ABEK75_12145 [Salinibacter sp.]
MPAYNEAERIEKTVQSVAKYVDKTLVVDDATKLLRIGSTRLLVSFSRRDFWPISVFQQL